jgi:hypothetical protein
MPRSLVSLALLAGALVASGCSSSTGAAAGDGGGSSGAAVSFSKDVMPILQMNCTSSAQCHGQKNYKLAENLYLGPSMGAIDAATAKAVHDQLVNVKSLEDPAMDLVTPGQPDKSYFLHKMNGDESKFNVDCASVPLCPSVLNCTKTMPCGADMPYLGESLTISNPMGLQQITDWITQGAPNN